MSIDSAAFTPLASLLGGLLIGLAALVLVLWNGRVAGISGILAGLVEPTRPIGDWRLAFLGGLLAAPVVLWLVGGAPGAEPAASPGVLVVSGLLVGLGTRIGGGCTSGHGVCGLGRLSPRSLVATLVFMTAGVVVAVLTRHAL